jgi:hypothetical protein
MKNRVSNLFGSALTAALPFLSQTAVRAQMGGVPLWTNFYTSGPGMAAAGMDLAVDRKGDIFVTGFAGFELQDFATVKYSGAGVPLWTNRFHASATDDRAMAIAVDANGNVFVTGPSPGNAGITIKYSGDGIPLWTNYLNAASDWRIAVDNSGKVFVAGSTRDVFLGVRADYITAAYSNSGLPLWTNYYNGPEDGSDHLRDLAVDASGNVVVTGSSASNFATIKYSEQGVPLWTNRFTDGGGNVHFAEAVAVDPGGNVFVTGRTLIGCATIKYSAAGAALWTNVYHEGGSASGTALASDLSGNIYVGGWADRTGSGLDFFTVKYSGTGLPLWTNRYNGLENLHDDVRSMGVDSGGNVFVYGESTYYDPTGNGVTLSATTVGYSSAGLPLWTNRYPSAAGTSSWVAQALAVDAAGNVLVLGNAALAPQFDRVYMTIKYSSALPRLTIHRTATNTVVLSWPSPSTGFALQQNTGLNDALTWSNVSAGIQDDGATKTLVTSPVAGNRFYRLHKP